MFKWCLNRLNGGLLDQQNTCLPEQLKRSPTKPLTVDALAYDEKMFLVMFLATSAGSFSHQSPVIISIISHLPTTRKKKQSARKFVYIVGNQFLNGTQTYNDWDLPMRLRKWIRRGAMPWPDDECAMESCP